jgi:DNA-3-methyladenine glycosylase II
MSAIGFPPEAVAHLREVDPVLAGIIDRVGDFEPSHEPDLWRALVDAIVSQQLSIRAAATIVGRIAATSRNGFPTPEEILALEEETLRGCGLSRAKVTYVRDLALRWRDGTLDPGRIPEMEDEAIITELTRVKGIGRWTAEMALIFTLRRPDVLPVDDLGFRTAVQRAYGMEARPDARTLRTLAEPWRPYRSVATLYLWRSLKS